MLANLQNAIRQNIAQTDLPEQVFVEAIEAALLAAARRVYGNNAEISVEINLEQGEIRCSVPKQVVDIMRDLSTEIPIEAARKLDADAKIGDKLEVEINPTEFGRIPAQLARQILRQKIKEAEREKIYEEFAGREGEVVTGHVQRFERGGIILDLEQTEAFLPPREIPRAKSYERGKRLQCLILEVKNETRGAPIVVSRTHRDLVSMLFEQEVPEIYEGQVRIMGVARDPGKRAKVAVMATEEGIDAVGTCVGVKGVRVQTIVDELDNEKIDLIEWNEEASVFIANALCPATVQRVELNADENSARVIVPDNELSLAIGRRGQNARLAAKLTGWKIDIKSESEATVSIDELFKPTAHSDENAPLHDSNGLEAEDKVLQSPELPSEDTKEVKAETANVSTEDVPALPIDVPQTEPENLSLKTEKSDAGDG